ncbi:MAG: sialate O-acetylesterase [Lentisphaerota bacterium]
MKTYLKLMSKVEFFGNGENMNNKILALRFIRKVVWGGLLLSASTSYCVPTTDVTLTLDPVFNDHMVLQREQPVRVWGKAKHGEPITVSFGGQAVRTETDKRGNWSVKLAPMRASAESRDLIVRGDNEVAIHDILVGEVWLCSGQSNMQLGLLEFTSGKEDIKTSDISQLRIFSVEFGLTATPQVSFNGGIKGWAVCSPESIPKVGPNGGSFSAVGYFFGRELQSKLGIPVGLIQSAWGGKRIEVFTPQSNPAPGLLSVDTPGAVYNAMIAPMIPMTIRGTIWYQGESNLEDKGVYELKMKKLIDAWRTVFQNPDMPFYFVEIAPFGSGKNPDALGELRAAQARVAATVPHTGMVHSLDNQVTIHPPNKRQTGERLARLALAKTYGVNVGKSITGPSFDSATREGAGVLVHFSETADALVTTDGGAVAGFEGQEAGGQWLPATAKILGDKVFVSVAGQKVTSVRFCWLETHQTNLRNAEGFPPSPFNVTVTQ